MSYRLIRKAQLLQKIPISSSTLHARLDPKSRYYDPSLPRPRYLPGGRIPYWMEADVDAWVALRLEGFNQSDANNAHNTNVFGKT
ncbi:MAG: AlpA family transcriptional regulator [Pseudomonadota bacterium]|nr:AlpA family transcriptional regulator [Pseudomonadota bacterium]